jgi:hypothetical protein
MRLDSSFCVRANAPIFCLEMTLVSRVTRKYGFISQYDFVARLHDSAWKCSVHTQTGTHTIFMECAGFCGLSGSVNRRPLHADRLQDSKWTEKNLSRTNPKRHTLYAWCRPPQTATCRPTASKSSRDGDDTRDRKVSAAQSAHNEVVDHWHCRLGHAWRDRMRELMRNNELLTIPDTPIATPVFVGSKAVTFYYRFHLHHNQTRRCKPQRCRLTATVDAFRMPLQCVVYR